MLPHDKNDKKKGRNGNDCDVYRFVRTLVVTISRHHQSQPYQFLFPVHYEIVDRTAATTTPHEVFELRRLVVEAVLTEQQQKLLLTGGFSYEILRVPEEDRASS